MNVIKRSILPLIKTQLDRGKSILLLGARQTGKTTMLSEIEVDISMTLMDTSLRRRYEAKPELLLNEVRLASEKKDNLLVFIDEIQKVPALLDNIQVLIDEKSAQFILTGSSARKLRQPPVNLLPGRVVKLQLDALAIDEIPHSNLDLNSMLIFGCLPGIALSDDLNNKEIDLQSYVDIYLEEEIRSEALVRNVGDFSRFLELAASESGYIVNMSKLSNQVGVSLKKLEGYFQILEDCLIAEKIEPVTETKSRRRLMQSKRYMLYDLGVRRIAADEGVKLPTKTMGHLFEQFVGQQIIFMLRSKLARAKIKFWRDSNGLKVDWVIEIDGAMIPIEVKYNDSPDGKMIKGCMAFLAEYDCPMGAFIVCQTQTDYRINDQVVAMSWRNLPNLLKDVVAKFT